MTTANVEACAGNGYFLSLKTNKHTETCYSLGWGVLVSEALLSHGFFSVLTSLPSDHAVLIFYLFIYFLLLLFRQSRLGR